MTTERGSFQEFQAALETDAGVTLGENRLVRSRLLRVASGALFGWAVSAFLPSYAWAHCPLNGNHPCFGYNLCGNYPTTGCENREARCCSNSLNRCSDDCNPAPQHETGCPGGGEVNCWSTCDNGTLYRCCDCHNDDGDGHCICRFIVGTCG